MHKQKETGFLSRLFWHYRLYYHVTVIFSNHFKLFPGFLSALLVNRRIPPAFVAGRLGVALDVVRAVVPLEPAKTAPCGSVLRI